MYRHVSPQLPQPSGKTEVIIWDAGARTQFPDSVTPHEEDLLAAQQEVIHTVRTLGGEKNKGGYAPENDIAKDPEWKVRRNPTPTSRIRCGVARESAAHPFWSKEY